MTAVQRSGLQVMEIRQTAPLPEVEQPPNGHRLVYYMLGGAFMDTIGEVYSGDLTLTPSASDPSKTLFTYTSTIVAKDPSLTAQFNDAIVSDFNTNRIPFLANWARTVAATPQCNTIAQSLQVQKTCTPVPQPTPVVSPSSPSAAAAISDWFYTFELPAGRPATPDTTSLLNYLLSKQPAHTGPTPEVLYAANVGACNFPAAHVPGPNLKKKWDVTLVIRFPVGCTVRPGEVGAGVAVDAYMVEVRPKPLPSEQIAAQCPDSPELAQAITAVKGEVDAMFGNFRTWYKMMQDHPSNPNLPVKPNDPMSGINLLTYKHDSGVIGQPCYQRYLLGAYKLIHGYGGGLYYFGDMVKHPGAAWQWDEIVIPLYNDGHVFFKVVYDPKYYPLLGLRDATLTDQANIDVVALPGSKMLIP